MKKGCWLDPAGGKLKTTRYIVQEAPEGSRSIVNAEVEVSRFARAANRCSAAN